MPQPLLYYLNFTQVHDIQDLHNLNRLESRTLIESSHRRCSVKKGVLRNFVKFTGTPFLQKTAWRLLLTNLLGINRFKVLNFIARLRKALKLSSEGSFICNFLKSTKCLNLKEFNASQKQQIRSQKQCLQLTLQNFFHRNFQDMLYMPS